MKKEFFFIAFCLTLFSSCIGNLGFIYKKHLVGNYYLTASDVIEQCALSYHNEKTDGHNWGEIIGSTVFSVGFNEKFLIAKQGAISYKERDRFHILPWRKEERVIGDIRYYILPIEKNMNWKTKNGLMGPLTELEFQEKRNALGINALTFSFNVDI